MSSSVVVRRIRPIDASALRDTRLAALADTPSAFGSTYDAEARFSESAWSTQASERSSGDWQTNFLAWSADDVVGLVGAYRTTHRPDCVELVSMWTSPTARRRGVAQQLVQAVLDWASAVGATSVELWVTRGNEPARRLYESFGFAETGVHQPLPSDPCATEVRMSRPLTPSNAES